CIPGGAAIYADLHLLYTAIAREGDSTNFNRTIERNLTAWAVNARDGMQGAIVPALIRVETTDKMICQFDAREPLGIFFAKASRHQGAQGIAMTHRQFGPVHAPRQQRVSLQHLVQG